MNINTLHEPVCRRAVSIFMEIKQAIEFHDQHFGSRGSTDASLLRMQPARNQILGRRDANLARQRQQVDINQ